MAELPADDDEMIQKLPNDIILDLITRLRLPLRHVARYAILNKYFNNYIARDHALLSLSSRSSINPIIFHQSSRYRFTIINSPLRKSVTLPNEVTIVDSCNGVLFLYCTWSKKYYLFNPLTGGTLSFDGYDQIHSSQWGSLALVVDIPAKPSSSSFDFKLVELRTEQRFTAGRTRLRFGVFVPSRGKSKLAKKYSYLDYGGSFITSYRPVYAHGCLHWIEVDATAIAVFDVESERPRIMDGPLVDLDARFRHDTYGPGPDYTRTTWFGLAQGSLQFIRAMRDEVIVHGHDHDTREWRVAHRIWIRDYMSGTRVHSRIPVFFSGESVFFHLQKMRSGKGSSTEEIHVHDLLIGGWSKSGQVEHSHGRHYMEFAPTTARVSDVYMSSKMSAGLRSALVGLQRLLLDPA